MDHCPARDVRHGGHFRLFHVSAKTGRGAARRNAPLARPIRLPPRVCGTVPPSAPKDSATAEPADTARGLDMAITEVSPAGSVFAQEHFSDTAENHSLIRAIEAVHEFGVSRSGPM